MSVSNAEMMVSALRFCQEQLLVPKEERDEAKLQNYFFLAAEEGWLNIVLILINNIGIAVNQVDNAGATALAYAAQNGQIAIVRFLRGQGAEVDHSDQNGASALLLAAQNGHEKTVEFLLKEGAEINQTNNNGATALMVAAQNGHLNTVKKLLEREAAVNQIDNFGTTALMRATLNSHTLIVQALCAKGANANYSNEEGASAFLMSAETGHIEIVELLLKEGAELNQADKKGLTALIIAAIIGHRALVKMVLEKGAAIHQMDKAGFTALMHAALNGHTLIVQDLCAKGAKANYLNKEGVSAFLLASSGGHTEIVEFLFKEGAEINQKDINGVTALMIAAKNGHLNTVKMLLNRGAAINQKDNYYYTALLHAAQNSHDDIIKYLLERGAKLPQHPTNFPILNIVDSKNKLLIIIDLENAKCSAESIQAMLDLLKTQQTLVRVYIFWKNELCEQYVLQIAEGLKEHDTLFHIDLWNDNQSDALYECMMTVNALLKRNHINEAQQYLIKETLQISLDQISEDYEQSEPEKAITVLQAMLAENNVNVQEPEFIRNEWGDTITNVRNMLSHPYPQNRNVGDALAAVVYLGKHPSIALRADEQEIENGIISYSINGIRMQYAGYWQGEDEHTEIRGLLTLTKKDDPALAPPVTREATVKVIRSVIEAELMRYKILMERKAYIFPANLSAEALDALSKNGATIIETLANNAGIKVTIASSRLLKALREKTGMHRVAVKKSQLTAEQLNYFKEKLPQVTVEAEKDSPRWLITAAKEIFAKVERVITDFEAVKNRVPPPPPPLLPSQSQAMGEKSPAPQSVPGKKVPPPPPPLPKSR